MDDPILTIEEREAINGGRWFSSLSPSLRHDILRCAFVKRYKDGELICRPRRSGRAVDRLRQGRGARELGLAVGQAGHADLRRAGHLVRRHRAVRRRPRTHDANAHGDTTMLCVARADFRELLAQHVELYEALLRLHAGACACCSTWWKTSTPCPCARGWPSSCCCWCAATACRTGDGSEIRIGLQLAQEDLAQLLGASRQRVNQELKGFERDGAVRIEPGGLVVLRPRRADAHLGSRRPINPADAQRHDPGLRQLRRHRAVSEQHAFDIGALERLAREATSTASPAR